MSAKRGQKTLDALARLSTKIDVAICLLKEVRQYDMNKYPDDVQESVIMRIAVLEETKTHLKSIADLQIKSVSKS